MTLKHYKPVSSSRRGLALVDRSSLWKGKPFKSLSEGKKSTGGRSRGRLTCRHRGGGHKKLYRNVNFKTIENACVVQRLEYDPNRSAFIALVQEENTAKHHYILAPESVKTGDRLGDQSKKGHKVSVGDRLKLKDLPVGILVHNIEFKIGKGGQMARAAGTSCQIMGQEGAYVMLRSPSNEVRRFHEECSATVGVVSNSDHKNRSLSKAGRVRWCGKRPTVRGSAMNPIDHPHGGGEGRTSGGRHPVSPTGVSAKGFKTRKKKKSSSKLIISRRK